MTDKPRPFPTAPEGSAFARLFAALAKAGSEYAGSTPKGGLFTCPVHEDGNASLSVDMGYKGVPLLSCPPCEARLGDHDEYMDELRGAGVRFAGEPTQAVNWGEPAVVASKPSGGSGKRKQSLSDTHVLTHTYAYRFEDGEDNFKINRWEPREPGGRKVFTPSRIEPGVGRVTNLDGVERTPYKLEMFKRWEGKSVYLVEGEKAATALLEARKRATCFHGGAKKEPEPGWTDRFQGFSEVRLWPDADAAGVAWMQRRYAELAEAGVKVAWWVDPSVEPDSGDDAFDVLDRGRAPVRVDAVGGLCTAPEPAKADPDLVVGGKALVTAGGLSLGGAPDDEEDEDDGPSPYKHSARTEPLGFTREYISRHYTDENGVATLRFYDYNFWRWNGTYYYKVDEEAMRSRLAHELEGALETVVLKDGIDVRPVSSTKSVRSELIDALKAVVLNSAENLGMGELLPVRGGVPFLNGYLNISTGELEHLGPERDTRWVVPDNYDPNAGRPVEWFKFLKSIGFTPSTPEYHVLREYLGYILSGETKHHKGLLLIGPTRSGKGTILNVIEAMTGDGHTPLSMKAFSDDFGLADVLGKTVATVGDARFSVRTDKDVIERILTMTGQDSIPINRKHKDPVNTRIGARLVMATNEVPSMLEASDAFAKRFLFVRFTESFYGREDIDLIDKLKAELPAIVKWALGGLRELHERGHFTESEVGKALQKQMEDLGNPIRAWIDEECELVGDGFETTDALYERYTYWADRGNFYKPNKIVFARDLAAAFESSKLDRMQKRIGSKMVRGFRGIRLGVHGA